MQLPFIEVTLNPVDQSMTYTLRPTGLGTNAYGIALATVAFYVAKMMEQEGGLDPEEVKAEIAKFFNAEIKTPTNTNAVSQLQ